MALPPSEGLSGNRSGKMLSDQAWEMARYGGDFPISKTSTVQLIMLITLNVFILR